MSTEKVENRMEMKDGSHCALYSFAFALRMRVCVCLVCLTESVSVCLNISVSLSLQVQWKGACVCVCVNVRERAASTSSARNNDCWPPVKLSKEGPENSILIKLYYGSPNVTYPWALAKLQMWCIASVVHLQMWSICNNP